MSRSINKAVLIGRLGVDPEIRYTPSGTPVVNLSLATHEVFTNRDGEKVEKTAWHRLVLWRQLAEIAGKYLQKGNTVYVEGPVRYRTWEDSEGRERATTEIEVREMTMLDGSRSEGNGQPESNGHPEEEEEVAVDW